MRNNGPCKPSFPMLFHKRWEGLPWRIVADQSVAKGTDPSVVQILQLVTPRQMVFVIETRFHQKVQVIPVNFLHLLCFCSLTTVFVLWICTDLDKQKKEHPIPNTSETYLYFLTNICHFFYTNQKNTYEAT